MSYFKTHDGSFFEFENVLATYDKGYSMSVTLFGPHHIEISNPEDMESFKEKFKEFLNEKYSTEEEVSAEDIL